jgi:hypothetical protein
MLEELPISSGTLYRIKRGGGVRMTTLRAIAKYVADRRVIRALDILLADPTQTLGPPAGG